MKKLLYFGLMVVSLIALSGCGKKDLSEVIKGSWNFDITLEDDDGSDTTTGTLTFYDNGEVDFAEDGESKYYTGKYKISENVLTVTYQSVYSFTGTVSTFDYKFDMDQVSSSKASGSVEFNSFIGDAPFPLQTGTVTLEKTK